MVKDKFIKLSIPTATVVIVSAGLFAAIATSLLQVHQASALSLSHLLDGITGRNQQPDQPSSNKPANQDDDTQSTPTVGTSNPAEQTKQTPTNGVEPQKSPQDATATLKQSSGTQPGLQSQQTTAVLMQPSNPRASENRDKSENGSAIQLSTNQARQAESIPSEYSSMQISTNQRNRLLVIAGSLTLLGATIYVMSYRLTPARVSIPVSIKRVMSRNPLLGR